MFRLVERTAEEGVKHHQANPVRVYENDEVQADRVRRARAMVAKAACDLYDELEPATRLLRIIELGCGTADISGPFLSEDDLVLAVDCHCAALLEAERRFPGIITVLRAIEEFEPRDCDLLVLCETLEHLEDPKALVREWLPLVRACVISHPIGEPMGSSTSGGDHCWSFNMDDFKAWFPMGGHELIEHEVFEMGSYRIALGRGRRTYE